MSVSPNRQWLTYERFIPQANVSELIVATIDGHPYQIIAWEASWKYILRWLWEWGIKNALHYRRDITFQEDRTKMKHHPAARGLAMIHNVVIALFARQGYTNHAHAQRLFDAHPIQAVALLLGL